MAENGSAYRDQEVRRNTHDKEITAGESVHQRKPIPHLGSRNSITSEVQVTEDDLKQFNQALNCHLANERTFLAWIRTATGLIALGFAVQKLDGHKERLTALLIFFVGLCTCLFGTLRYYTIKNQLDLLLVKFKAGRIGIRWTVLFLGFLFLCASLVVALDTFVDDKGNFSLTKVQPVKEKKKSMWSKKKEDPHPHPPETLSPPHPTSRVFDSDLVLNSGVGGDSGKGKAGPVFTVGLSADEYEAIARRRLSQEREQERRPEKKKGSSLFSFLLPSEKEPRPRQRSQDVRAHAEPSSSFWDSSFGGGDEFEFEGDEVPRW
uniref:DUF202 domain-containing protein n=1 Tax=Chromera velia CCMP2878 TaxID=1169474 RepID=A0A0G4ID27_9ALVE|eukprot:Cvel_13220.t1-p1 / transcript=Cvel_13220.t1 / gene=Cvel_13220 / organism=Chromera_velia_CCMP2878 / gene_product=hypothetical protein / transcript_product=hypothetical protein / location=Cvel_scaffold895:5595-9640(-) / protein_length=319 / sequence_SO=supercontig / SO=protein_coding / is_pseudo=false